MSLLGLKAASVLGIAALMLPTEPQFWIACTTGATVLGSIIMQILKNIEDDKRYRRDRQAMLDHQAELKADVARVAVVAKTEASGIRQDIAANTELTAHVGAKADAAYEAANNVNEKIASMTRPVAATAAVAADTNKTVHRIEDNR